MPTELADAIRRVGRGLTVFDDSAPSGMVLTDRERQVLERVAGGMTNAEIATELHLSPNTVKQHASGCSARSARATAPRPCSAPSAWV